MGGIGSGGNGRKPHALHELGGTTRSRQQRRLSDVAPAELGEAPKRPPAWLSAEGKRFFKAHAATLAARGLLTGLDFSMFVTTCAAWGRWREAEALIERDGLVITDIKGRRQPNPAVRIAGTAGRDFAGLAKLFGLVPATRERMPAPPPAPPADPFDEWLAHGEAGAVPALDVKKLLKTLEG